MRKQIVSYEVTCDKCDGGAGQGMDKISTYSFSCGENYGSVDLCLECSYDMDNALRFLKSIGIVITKKQIDGTEVTE